MAHDTPHSSTIRYWGKVLTISNWSGVYDDVGEPSGSGSFVDSLGRGWLCTLDHGVVSGCHMISYPDGNRAAGTCNAEGQRHGNRVWFGANGRIAHYVFNNGVE